MNNTNEVTVYSQNNGFYKCEFASHLRFLPCAFQTFKTFVKKNKNEFYAINDKAIYHVAVQNQLYNKICSGEFDTIDPMAETGYGHHSSTNTIRFYKGYQNCFLDWQVFHLGQGKCVKELHGQILEDKSKVFYFGKECECSSHDCSTMCDDAQHLQCAPLRYICILFDACIGYLGHFYLPFEPHCFIDTVIEHDELLVKEVMHVQSNIFNNVTIECSK